VSSRFAGFNVCRFLRICLAFGFFLPPFTFMELIWQTVFNMSKTSLLSDRS
jgi:hypothetical protein